MEIKDVIDGLGKSFDEFKKANDERIAKLEKGAATSDFEAKLAAITADIEKFQSEKSAIEARINKLAIGGGNADPKNEAKDAHRAAYAKFMRKGFEDGLKELEAKAVNITTDADGGYAVPEVIESQVMSQIVDISPVRSVATVRTISTSDYKQLVDVRGTASGWVDEDDARTATNSPQLAQVTPFMGELYANPQATQQSLDDIFFDVEAWLAGSIATEFARAEGNAFVAGNGTKKPKGFTAYTTAATADGSRAFGTLQHILTGADGGFAASNPADSLITTVYSLKSGLRQGAVWMMNKATAAMVRKLKDGNDQYLWAPGLAAGQPATLLGYPVVEAEDMPAVAADSLSIAFGNFAAGYLIVDRVGIRTLRDPYSFKPYVGFYTTKRVGGAVMDSDAIKLVKFGDA